VLTKLLESRQIQYGIHYPQPIHLSQAHADLGYKRGDFPVSESVCERILSLPIYPELTRSQVEEVAAAVRDAHAD
jgi:dTDP-4-amino-4,6-dideoxygalactose transaminase